MKGNNLVTVAVAALIGVFYSWYAAQFWASYSIGNPFAAWLRDAISPRDHRVLHLAIIYLHDTVVNVAIAAPFAAVLLLFPRLRNWTSLLVAAGVAMLMPFWGADWSGMATVSQHFGFWFGLAVPILSLPMAYLGVRAAQGR